jgi:hypothetical protein
LKTPGQNNIRKEGGGRRPYRELKEVKGAGDITQ